jgi:hypothetical protein
MGGPNRSDFHTCVLDGKIQSCFRDPVFKAACMEANKWYREGLILETAFSDSGDTFLEKLSDGRSGLVYYDFSQDSVNRFRKIMMETYPGNEYVIVGSQAGGTATDVYPPSAGVTKVYPDQKDTMGWNVHGITPKAKNPQRIFDFLSYMLTWQGSIEMMYGPEGDLWSGLDSNKAPILHTPEALISESDNSRVGTWRWSFCNLADPVDLCKFAVNRAAPPEERDWTISMQSDVLSPIMFCTDEFANINVVIDPQSDLGLKKEMMWQNEIKDKMPKLVMASSADECSGMYDDLLAALEANGLAEIEGLYTGKWKDNCVLQGFTAYEGR